MRPAVSRTVHALEPLGRGLARLGRSPWTTWVGLAAVPLLVAGLLTWAFGNGLVNQGSAVAAVVNDDEPVTINGQLIPLGRQLVGQLVDGPDKRYQWMLTNSEDAAKGLDNGDYAAVVTIPPTFSRRSTSAATTKDPLTAEQGTITVTTSHQASVADALLSKDVTDATVAALGKQVVETYLDNVYLGFSTIHSKIGEAADGAGKLADGTGSLSSGSARLANGTSTLVVGLGDLRTGLGRAQTGVRALVDGAHRLRTGTGALATGSKALADGTGKLVTGADQLATGLADAKTQTADLPAQTRKLADGAAQVSTGAAQVAAGNRQLANTVVPYADKAVNLLDAIPPVSTAADQVAALADRCQQSSTTTTTTTAAGTPAAGATDGAGGGGGGGGSTTTTKTTNALPAEFCADLKQATGRLISQASALDAKKASVRSQVVQLRDGVKQLADGSAQVASGAKLVADGAGQLADASPKLTAGIASAADGAAQLHTGLVTADSGARTLAGGSKQVATGTATLSKGADTLAAGVRQLVSGSGDAQSGARDLSRGAFQLLDGANQVDDGANRLADGLDSSRGSVPTYTQAERDHLKAMAATPAVARSDNGTVVGKITGSFFLVLALWVGALTTFLALRSLPSNALTSRRTTWGLMARTALPAAAVTTASAGVLAASLAAYLGLGAARGAALTAVVVAAALVFTLVNQALAAGFGRRGQAVSLVALLLTASVGVLSTVPSALKSLEATLPTHDALVAVRAIATGSSGGLAGALFDLALWALLALALVAFATDRQRALKPKLLRTSRPALGDR